MHQNDGGFMARAKAELDAKRAKQAAEEAESAKPTLRIAAENTRARVATQAPRTGNAARGVVTKGKDGKCVQAFATDDDPSAASSSAELQGNPSASRLHLLRTGVNFDTAC